MPLAATWMDLEIIVSEVKSDRDTQIPYDMWNLKYGINEPIYKKDRLMDWENRLVVAKLRVGREEGRTGNLGLVDANY